MNLTEVNERQMLYHWIQKNTSELLRNEFLTQKDITLPIAVAAFKEHDE